MSPQYYLAEMTGFSLPCWARSKKHATFKEKNRMGFFQIFKFFHVLKIIIRTFFFFLTIQLMSLHISFYDSGPLNNQDCSFLAYSQLQVIQGWGTWIRSSITPCNLKPYNGKLCTGHRNSLQGMLLGDFGTKRWIWGSKRQERDGKGRQEVFKAALSKFLKILISRTNYKATTVFQDGGTQGGKKPHSPQCPDCKGI